MKKVVLPSPKDAALLRQILENPVDGYSTAQMLSAAKVISRIPDETNFTLEDADYEFVMTAMGAVRWARATADTAAFVLALQGATDA